MAVLRSKNQIFLVDALIDFEFRMEFLKFSNSSLRIESRIPRTIWEQFFGQVIKNGIRDHAVAPDRSQGGMGIKFDQYILAGKVTIQTNDDLLMGFGDTVNLGNCL